MVFYKIRIPIGIYLLMILCLQGIDTNAGQSFLVVFSNEKFNASIYLSISLVDNDTSSQVSVTAPRNIEVLNETFELGTHGSLTTLLSVNATLIAGESTKYSDNVVLVQSDKRIIMLVLSDVDDSNKISSGAFLALPLDQLSSHYVVVTSCRATQCFIVVASTVDKNEVTVNLTRSALGITYNGNYFNGGGEIDERLDAFESMQLLGYENDLTGTMVTSEKPVAVFSGGVFGQVPRSILLNYQHTYLKQDKSVEQMPSLESLGNVYVMRSSGSGQSSMPVYIVPLDLSTSINVSGTDAPIEQLTANSYILLIEDAQTVILESNKPVLIVAGLPAEMSPDNVDPSLSLAMPVSMWGPSYVTSLVNLGGEIWTHTVIVMTPENCTGHFMINRRSLIVSNWTVQDNYKTGLLALDVDLMQINSRIDISSRDCVFGGYIVGGSGEDFKTWAYPLGWGSHNTDLNDTDFIYTTKSPIDDVTTGYFTTTKQNDESSDPSSSDTTSSVTTMETEPVIPDTTNGKSSTTSDMSTTTKILRSSETTTFGVMGSETTVNRETLESDKGTYTLHLCPCECLSDLDWIANITASEKEMQRMAIIEELQIDKSILSRGLRRKQSFFDKRPSSTYVGSLVTILTCLAVVAFIVGPDVLDALRFLVRAYATTIKNGW